VSTVAQNLAQNLVNVRGRMATACERAGRDPSEVRLVAASKTVEPARIIEALAAGQFVFGENYVQEARHKAEAVARHKAESVTGAVWHLLGHLQGNKAAQAVKLFALIHSLDSLRLAEDLSRRAEQAGKVQPVLIEVNLAGELSKTGIDEAETLALVRRVGALPNLDLQGLMCLPPFFDEPERARSYFVRLRRLRDELRQASGLPLSELSMGMSGDFEVAIEEGATLVRVGTAIFGRRAIA